MIDFRLQKKLNTNEGTMLLDVAATIAKGQLVCLYGPSGAGKTSILRMIAGFMLPDAGIVKVNGTVWCDRSQKIDRSPQQRGAGFVFQNYALFPNLTVRENISYGLGKNDPKEIVDELMEITGLAGLAARRVPGLSGGQQQRVALARALARKPGLLLLDEPLSALDREKREQLQETLRQLHVRFELTTILVSHDEDEILKLADQVIHLDQGKFIVQTTPSRFFTRETAGQVVKGTVISREMDGVAIVRLRDRVIKIAGVGDDIEMHTEVEITLEKDQLVLRKINR